MSHVTLHCILAGSSSRLKRMRIGDDELTQILISSLAGLLACMNLGQHNVTQHKEGGSSGSKRNETARAGDAQIQRQPRVRFEMMENATVKPPHQNRDDRRTKRAGVNFGVRGH